MARDGDQFDATKRQVRDLNVASSRTTQQQLNQLRISAASESSTEHPEIVVVSVPDVTTFRPTDSRSKPERVPSVATVPFDRSAARSDLSTSGADSPNPALNISPSLGAPNLSSPTVFIAPETKPTSGASPATSSPAPADAPSAEPTGEEPDAWWYSLSNLANDRPIAEVTRRICSQFPSIAPATLMFTSADPELSTNRATARVAASLARLTGCRVLLVDVNWEMNISPLKQSGDAVLGITEVLADNRSWNEFIIETQDRLLHVLPCGITDVPMRRIGPDTLMSLNSQWQRDYTYVCINAGSVKQLIARRLAVCCDGTYILVGLNQTTKKDAQSAMKLMVENHARVLGAIVFDTPAQA